MEVEESLRVSDLAVGEAGTDEDGDRMGVRRG